MSQLSTRLKWAMKQRATGLLRLLIGTALVLVCLYQLAIHAPWIFFGVVLIGTGCGIWATCFEPRWVHRRHFVHEVRGLRPGERVRLAVLGDLHVGAPHFGEEALERVVDRVIDEDVDALILVGDYVIQEVLGGRPVPIERIAALLKKAGLPMIAITGNHDFWDGRTRIRAALSAAGAVVLENEHHVLELEGVKLCVVGLEDESTGKPNPHAAFPSQRPDHPLLVLAHDPATFLRNMPLPGDLLLAGHTHGGQVRLPGVGALVVPGRSPLAWSLGWTETSSGPLYVTSGLGTSLLPMRFFCPPEYVVLELVTEAEHRTKPVVF
jgi:predicted MPP superfamily phosphohydrolase